MSSDTGAAKPAPSRREAARDAELLKRRLRIALIKARQAANLTQKATADALDWSASKVVRIEQGSVPVAPSDVRVLLSVLGVTDSERTEELVRLARQAREAKGWSEYDDILTPGFRELISQEASAAHIWKYEPFVVPGYFQTTEYAFALLSALGFTGEAAVRRAEVRAKRQQILEDASPRPEIHIVIGEAALIRPVGDSTLMRNQIGELIDASRRPGTNLFLLPFSAGAHRGMGNAFTLLQFDDPDLDDSLYLEDAEKKTSSRDEPAQVARYLDLYNYLEKFALDTGTFEDHAKRIIDQLYSK